MDIDPRVLPDSSNEEEEQVTLKTPEAEVPAESTEDVEELRRKAEVSSQNFERAKKAELEVKELRKQLETKSSAQVQPDDDLFSDEGKLLRSEISALRTTISKFEKEQEEQTIYSQFPELSDKKEEFNEFFNDPDNAGIKKDRLAKLFLMEKGLLESKPQRKGLEKPTGGSKAGQKSGISQDEIKRLRENQPRRYQQMIQSGKINPDNIV